MASLAGIWESAQRIDIAHSNQNARETHFREYLTFTPLRPVVNGLQVLFGLRYSTVARPLIQEQPFHEEVASGYGMPGEPK